MTYILGISSFYHDSSAALIKDGEIIAAVQEERFTRIKHDSSFPTMSIKFLFDEANITARDINYVVFYEKPFLKFERLIKSYIDNFPKGFNQFRVAAPIWIKNKLFLKQYIYKFFKKLDKDFKRDKILFTEHHESHAASAFYPSPFKDSLIINIDGVGEWATTSIFEGRNNKLKKLREINFPNSLGLLYSAFTYYLGFKVNSGEYKLMGLAPYGEPIYTDLIKNNLLSINDDGSFIINQKYFSYSTDLKMINRNFINLFGKEPRKTDSDNYEKFYLDIASSIQKVTEEIIVKIAKFAKREFNHKNLCLSGGVALNCVANGKLLKSELFENIWIQPSSGDAGCSLGAALCIWHNYLDKKRNIDPQKDSMKGSYLGPSFTNIEINNFLKLNEFIYSFYEDNALFDILSKNLNEGHVIGLFQGKMEFGPRALGNRSIIGDPRIEDMQRKLNLKIKFRESFRPFAPSVMKEYQKEYFDIDEDSPYMLLVGNINDKKKLSINEFNLNMNERLNLKRSLIPSVTHVDYSARVHTVTEESNNRFYKLLKTHYKNYNCPVLINTSFNVRGEPIVNSLEDACNCFMGTDMDILVLQNYLLFKKDQKNKEVSQYFEKFEKD